MEEPSFSLPTAKCVRGEEGWSYPRITAVAVVLDEIGDVVYKHSTQGLIGPVHGWGGDPVWQLVIPDQIVASNELPRRLCECQEVV